MDFAQPGWFALLVLLPILGAGAAIIARLRRKQWAPFVAPRLRDSLVKRGKSLPRWLALFFLLVACAAMVIGMARPQGEAGVRTEKTLGRNVMIALDISRSMRVTDVKPDRLAQAKVVIYELLEAMPNERIGFIAFAGDAFVHAPLTVDHTAVRETIEQIDENWAPLGGSNLAAAVSLATETLKETGQKNNALVILSDGERHDGDLDAMIAEAEQAGVFIVAIGVGTEAGGYVPNPGSISGQMTDRSGQPVRSSLQPDVMRKLAEETRGRFTVAGSGLDIPALVMWVVKDLDAFEMDGRERRIFVEFYQWLVFPAIVLLIFAIVAGTRWRGIQTTAAIVATGFFTLQNADASAASRAMEALQAERHEEAQDAYHELAEKEKPGEKRARYRLGEATAAYRAGDFRAARTAFSESLLSTDTKVQASGHLGMGNTLFQLGWKSLSGENYPTEDDSIPDLDRFDALVKEELAKMRESAPPEDGDTAGIVKMESLITNWADSVRHYDSTLSRIPTDKVARKNRDLTMIYLKRLAELLNEEEETTQESMPQPQPGEGPPQEGEGDGEPQEGEGDEEGEKQPGDKGEGEDEPRDGSGKEGDKEKDGKKGDKKDEETDGEGENPNESPEERAHRILKENADLEKGPITPGRREYREAEKDW